MRERLGERWKGVFWCVWSPYRYTARGGGHTRCVDDNDAMLSDCPGCGRGREMSVTTTVKRTGELVIQIWVGGILKQTSTASGGFTPSIIFRLINSHA